MGVVKKKINRGRAKKQNVTIIYLKHGFMYGVLFKIFLKIFLVVIRNITIKIIPKYYNLELIIKRQRVQ